MVIVKKDIALIPPTLIITVCVLTCILPTLIAWAPIIQSVRLTYGRHRMGKQERNFAYVTAAIVITALALLTAGITAGQIIFFYAYPPGLISGTLGWRHSTLHKDTKSKWLWEE